MNTAWVLVALIYNGHMSYGMIPTMEFKSPQACRAALMALEADAEDNRIGAARFRCVAIPRD